MAELFNSYTDILVFNSIVNNLDDEKFDLSKPFTFIEFLNYIKSLSNELENFKNYEIYLEQWNNLDTSKKNSFNSDIKTQYVNLFKELSLKFSNDEEKRYLQNIDFQNDENLTIAIPFYVKKIKEISLYYKEKRDIFSASLRDIKNKGTTVSIEDYIKSKIIDLFQGDDIPPNIQTLLPLSAFQKNLSIEIEESYDVFNDYYDLDPDIIPDFYNASSDRKKYFTSNTNYIDENSFLDLDKAIIEIINDKNITLSELNPTSPKAIFSEPKIDLLENTDYIDYKKTGRENLKLFFEAELVKNLLGTDFYYLSTNTSGSFLSGELFNSNNKINNILNVNYPSTFTVPSTSNNYERNVGLFYKPANFSILKMKGGFDFTLKNNLSSDQIYIFPDPANYGNINGLSKEKHVSPFDFILDNKVYKNISSGVGQNSVKSYSNDQNFYSYNSFEQNRNNTNLLSSFNSPIPNLVNFGIIENINTDIYGNKFVEYIQDNSFVQNFSKDNIVRDKINFAGSNTLTSFEYKSEKLNFFDKKISNKYVYVQNVSTNKYEPLSSSFINVFKKYKNNINLFDQLNNSINNINIYENVFSITTPSFLLVDEFNYDGNFKPTNKTPLLENIILTDDSFTGITNDYVVDNKIYKVVINLLPTASATNDIFYYEFFSYDLKEKIQIPIINRNNTSNEYFNTNFNLSLSAVPKRLRNAHLTYSSKINNFNLLVQYNDLNENAYLHNFIFKIFDNQLSIEDNTVYTPTNYYNTNNFYNENLSSSFITTSISGDLIQDKENGILFL